MPKWRPYIYALIGAAVALLIGLVMLIDRGTREHDIIVSSPSPPGVFIDERLPLKAGDLVCVGPMRFTPAAGRVRLVAETRANPVPPLRITSRTGTTKKTTVVRNYPTGKITQILVPFTVTETASGSVCVRNTGDATVSLAASNEPRYFSLATTKLNGKVAPQNLRASVQLLAADRSTIIKRLPDAVRQDAQLTGVLPRWIVWLLLAGVLVAIIAGPLYVMTDVLRRDDESSG